MINGLQKLKHVKGIFKYVKFDVSVMIVKYQSDISMIRLGYHGNITVAIS